MMKKNIRKFLLLCLSFTLLLFVSCTGDAKITLKENGSVAFSFRGTLGEAFQDMMTGSGSDLSSIDEQGIAKALFQCGFESIDVRCDSINNIIKISFEDKDHDSYLFTEDIINIVDDEIQFSLTSNQFLSLYEKSGEDITMLLDLFLSPVLNDEVMSEEEYIETINVTYGEEAGKELRTSNVNFIITDKNGKSKNKSVYATSIFCGVPLKL